MPTGGKKKAKDRKLYNENIEHLWTQTKQSPVCYYAFKQKKNTFEITVTLGRKPF